LTSSLASMSMERAKDKGLAVGNLVLG
jgi:hypothetical protein